MTDMMITISMQIFEDMADRIEELEAKLAQQDALWKGVGREMEESDAREARLEAKLAKAVAALRKLGEAGKAHGYGSSYIICHNCSDTHHAVDAILVELKGQDQ